MVFGFAVAVAITDFATQHQREIFAQREEPSLVVGQGVVLQVAARQGDFAVYAGQVTASRPQGIVGFVAAQPMVPLYNQPLKLPTPLPSPLPYWLIKSA